MVCTYLSAKLLLKEKQLENYSQEPAPYTPMMAALLIHRQLLYVASAGLSHLKN
jgi:hypothetical protein